MFGSVVRTAAILLIALAAADAAPLSAERARAKAIAILQGDPYGTSAAEVARTIKDVQFLPHGSAQACGRTNALWQFHVVVVTDRKEQFNKGVIDGYLWLDAATGKKLCANLPLLD